MILLTFLLSSLGVAGAEGLTDEDLLMPDQAFQIQGRTDGPDQLIVQWRIADGYYMYRDKIRFETDSPGITLSGAILPEAKVKHDEFFGDVAIYRGQVSARIPIQREAEASETISLQARSQGCADRGICFPPHVQELLLALEPPPPVSQVAAVEPDLPALLDNTTPAMLGAEEDEILPPDEAYQLSVLVEDGTHLRLLWNIAQDTYLYHDKIELKLLDGQGVAIGDYELPKPEIKPDSVRPDGSIGDVALYHNEIDLKVPLQRSNSAATEITLEAAYQGCAERGICYPPIRRQFRLALPAIDQAAAAQTPPSPPAQASPQTESVVASSPPPTRSEVDEITATLQGGSLLVVVGVFFLLGLGLAFTPCIFPMIPILSGIIAGQGANITTRKAFVLSLVYVLAMALTYTFAGVLAGLFGGNLQASFQNPWILSAFAGVFVLLALSMFGFYELQLPTALQSRLTEISNKQQGGTLIGVAIMGLLSALIVGPCVAPPLAGALIYIGQTGDALLGGLALFALSMGMGAPLLAIGASAGKLLPRAGSWMNAVKAVFGVALLGVAIVLLERIIPTGIAMLLWGILLIVSAIYMGALRHLEIEASGWQKLWKGIGVVFLVYGALMLVGAAAGGKDTLQPLRGLVMAGGGSHTDRELVFQRIKTLEDLQREVSAASARGQTVMLDFYADWCVSCKEMEKYTFSDPRVIEVLQETLLLQADVTANDAADQALLQGHFGLPGPPAIMFYGADGEERKNYRVIGFKPAEEFAAHVGDALR
jgi:thiol:disulfide interchange protein DsbD